MKKEILIAYICASLILITPFTVIAEENKINPNDIGNIITVDDEGDGDYTSIKDALNHTNPGDTIEVYSGTYNEHTIVIETENIILEGISHELGNGSDTGKPFIDGPGTDQIALIDIKTDYVTINGFRIENNGGVYGNVIIWISKESDGCTISNNDIAHTTTSCIWSDGSNNKILNNNISHSVIRQGVVLCDPCRNCLVFGNAIFDVETGILCWDSNRNTVTGNKISRCSDFGIDIVSSNFNTVKGNIFEDNTFGVHILHSLGNRIKNNNFINNHIQAQFVYGIPSFLDLTNRWNGNYWNESRSLPYPIRGLYLYFFPWIQFDWHPAKEPYDI